MVSLSDHQCRHRHTQIFVCHSLQRTHRLVPSSSWLPPTVDPFVFWVSLRRHAILLLESHDVAPDGKSKSYIHRQNPGRHRDKSAKQFGDFGGISGVALGKKRKQLSPMDLICPHELLVAETPTFYTTKAVECLPLSRSRHRLGEELIALQKCDAGPHDGYGPSWVVFLARGGG